MNTFTGGRLPFSYGLVKACTGEMGPGGRSTLPGAQTLGEEPALFRKPGPATLTQGSGHHPIESPQRSRGHESPLAVLSRSLHTYAGPRFAFYPRKHSPEKNYPLEI